MIYIPTNSAVLDADKILEKINLKSAMVIADLGCGTSGHFVFSSAKMVGEEGEVYAVDIQESAISSIKSKAKLQNFYNIKEIWADIEVYEGTGIPKETCDAVYLINVHAKEGMLKEALRILKNGAKLLIIDWKATDTNSFGPPKESRVSKEEIKTRIKLFNLKIEEEFDAGPYHWGLIYTK